MKYNIKYLFSIFIRIFKKLERPLLILAILVCLFLLALRFDFISLGSQFQKKTIKSAQSDNHEIEQIKAANNLTEQVQLYKKLIEREGIDQAQEDLYKSGLPFTGQTHLLNHVAGDYLYEKYGPKGLTQCKEYFLASCYHGFILHAIAVGGLAEVKNTFDECLKGGSTIYTQCSHAIGHGFLTNEGYKNLHQALLTCDKAGNTITNFPLFNCYDGVFMENIWAVHDGETSKDRWVNPEDYNYPCNSPILEKKYLRACWANQPSLVYQLFKGDVKKTADLLCNQITNTEFQIACFDGLARQIHPLTKGSIQKTFEYCKLMPSKWIDFCVSVNAGGSFSVGDRSMSFELCTKISQQGKQDCYLRLINMLNAYAKNLEEKMNLCSKIKEEKWRHECEIFTYPTQPDSQ